MKLVLKTYDGLDVQTSILDSSKSNVFIAASAFDKLELLDSSGNCILSVVSPLQS